MVEQQISREFGRIESPKDERDFDLFSFIPMKIDSLPKFKKWDFPIDEPLDQKQTPHCVGFSMAHFGINMPIHAFYNTEDAHNFYFKCKEVDGFPNRDGTTIRAAATVLRNVGLIEAYAFARSMATLEYWLLTRGPVIIGVRWTTEMMFPDENGIITIGGQTLGGHAVLVNEKTEDGYFGFKNSWGKNWGLNGKGYIKREDLAKLLADRGEALTAVQLEEYKLERDPWLVRIIKNIIKQLTLYFRTQAN